jgi:hypothetical protein
VSEVAWVTSDVETFGGPVFVPRLYRNLLHLAREKYPNFYTGQRIVRTSGAHLSKIITTTRNSSLTCSGAGPRRTIDKLFHLSTPVQDREKYFPIVLGQQQIESKNEQKNIKKSFTLNTNNMKINELRRADQIIFSNYRFTSLLFN